MEIECKKKKKTVEKLDLFMRYLEKYNASVFFPEKKYKNKYSLCCILYFFLTTRRCIVPITLAYF